MSILCDLLFHREKDLTEKLEHFRVLLKKLPLENYNNLRWLWTHYAHLFFFEQNHMIRSLRGCYLRSKQGLSHFQPQSVCQSICLQTEMPQHTSMVLSEKETVICWLVKPTALQYVFFSVVSLSGIWSRSCICCPSSRLWIRWRPATLPSSWGPTSSGHELKGV